MIGLLKDWFHEEYIGGRLRTFETYAAIFMFGCIFGWVYEEIFYFFAEGCQFVIRGSYYGPWLPVYGVGAVVMILLVDRLRKNPLWVFLAGAILCGIVEYVTGYVIYNYMGGQRLWNYNTEPLNFGNIGGFVCLRSVVFFGLSGLFLIYVVAPTIRHYSMHLKHRTFVLITFIPVAWLIIGIIVNAVLA